MKTLQSRNVALASTSYTFRTQKYHGRDHIVVPVVALVEGVVHAMNSEHAELVTAEEFSHAPGGWNGRPIFFGHPQQDGEPVSGNSPGLLETEMIGTVFNAAIRKGKLTMEAWIDVALAEERAPELLARVRAGKAVEISVGVFVDTDDSTGIHGGKSYKGAWHDIVPDHLALLPKADAGACSNEMGCGVRAAKGAGVDPNMYSEWLEDGAETDELLKTLRNIPADERAKLADGDFAGPNRSFPIAAPEDVAAAASSLGRAKGDRNAIKRRIVSIAYGKGESYVAQLPEGWRKKTDQKMAGGLFRRLMDAFRGAQTPDEMTDNDLRRKLYEALKEKEPNVMNVDAWHPVSDPSHVVYTCYHQSTGVGPEAGMGYQYEMYERAFDLSDSGVVTLNDARIEVEPVMRYEPVEGTQPTVAASNENPASGAPCSCKHGNAPKQLSSNKETDMTKQERVKALIAKGKTFTEADQTFLESASDDQLVRFEAAAAVVVPPVVETPKVATTPAVVETPVVVTPKAPTFDEILATADPATRDSILAGKVLGEQRKASTIAALKATGRCKMTDADLASKSQADLDVLVELAGSNVRAAIDYSGKGGPKETTNTDAVPAPADLGAAIRASREKK